MYEVIYENNPDVIKIGPITSSKKELIDIFKAWLAISAAFGIAIAGGYLALFNINIFYYFAISCATVGVAFIIHELSHKIVAQKYHCWAEFRSFDTMLFLALGMSLLGFVFAAPGAVMIVGTVTRDRNGKISLAGPLANLVAALLFLGIAFTVSASGFVAALINYGFLINAWLGLFNLIPVWNFDGKKILDWSKPVYFVTLVLAISLFILTFI